MDTEEASEGKKDLEELIEERIREGLEEERKKRRELEEKVERLENEEEEAHGYEEPEESGNGKRPETNEDVEGSSFSRRQFLKGIGVAGLGALTFASPVASKMRITSKSIKKDGQSIHKGGIFNLSDYMALDGTNSMNANLDMSSNDIKNVAKVIANNIQTTKLDASGETRIEARSSDPSSPNNRRVWLRTDKNQIRAQINGTKYATKQLNMILPSLVSHLTLDKADTDTGAKTALDVANNNDGIYSGVTTGVSGIASYDSGEAYDFNGGRISVPNSSRFESSTFSISMWVNRDNTGDYDWLTESHDYSSPRDGFRMYISSNDHFVFNVTIDGTDTTIDTSGTVSPSAGTTYHVVATRDSSGMSLYVDGTEEASTGSHSYTPVSKEITIGSRFQNGSYDLPMDGVIDDWRFYDKRLTATEVSNLFSNGSI